MAFFADAERGRRRRRRQHGVHAGLEAGLEVALDQRAHFLRAQIISVVITGREHIGADHYAPAHFGTETFATRTLIHVGDVAARHTQAIAHAVIAREIG